MAGRNTQEGVISKSVQVSESQQKEIADLFFKLSFIDSLEIVDNKVMSLTPIVLFLNVSFQSA